MPTHRIRRRGLVRALPLALALAAPAAAQAPSPLPLGQVARGSALATWQALELTAAQRTVLALLLADLPARREATRQDTRSFLDAADTALADEQADLATLAAEGERLVDQRLAAARELRDRLIHFYETQLDDRQQALVREQLRRRLAQLDGLLALGDELRAVLGLP